LQIRILSKKNFKTDISAKSAAIQGSGWGWLAYNKVISADLYGILSQRYSDALCRASIERELPSFKL
jgi:superoxide dismutase